MIVWNGFDIVCFIIFGLLGLVCLFFTLQDKINKYFKKKKSKEDMDKFW